MRNNVVSCRSLLTGVLLALIIAAIYQVWSSTFDIGVEAQPMPDTLQNKENTTSSRASPQTIPTSNITDPNLEIQAVFSGLSFPSAMEFLGPNDILVLEKNNGTILRIVNGTELKEPVLDVAVANLVERGMLGIAIAGQDQQTNTANQQTPTRVFLYYTEGKEDGSDAKGEATLGNRLYRYDLIDGKLKNPKLFLDIEANRGASHNGGKMLIGPDNNVYLVVGDVAAHKGRTQNYQNSSAITETSVIFRLTQDGQSAGAILGRDDPINKFYAYGIRNSFGMDFDPVTGKLWDTENGPTYGDEINQVEPGFDSGWTDFTGISDLISHRSDVSTKKFDPQKDLVSCLYCTRSTGFLDKWINQVFFGIQDGRYSEPEFTWNATVAPTGLQFLDSDKLGGKYKNDMFVADIRGNIFHFDLNKNRDALVLNGSLSDKIADTPEELKPITFVSGFYAGIVDLDVGPDGYLYFMTYYSHEASIYRIVPKGTPPPGT